MQLEPNGELVPAGGGDSIPLDREVLTIGRRETCDVCLRFPNISSQHCTLTFRKGYWYIKDLNSTNGTKVNGERILQEKLLHPSDKVTLGKRLYEIVYQLPAGTDRILEDETENIMSQSLMEKAGLERRDRPRTRPAKRPAPSDFNPADFLLEDDD